MGAWDIVIVGTAVLGALAFFVLRVRRSAMHRAGCRKAGRPDCPTCSGCH